MIIMARFICVDPRQQTDLWMPQSSVLAAVELVLQQLDLEQGERSSESVARPPEVSHSADRWAREQRPVTMTGSERSHESEIPWQ
ncbi:MAG TPA: hypothetical protein VKB85_15155 [Propionibacteriaceae bacterium]|nr:hypothetical protein [Propionibacteriaceae bacterium]